MVTPPTVFGQGRSSLSLNAPGLSKFQCYRLTANAKVAFLNIGLLFGEKIFLLGILVLICFVERDQQAYT